MELSVQKMQQLGSIMMVHHSQRMQVLKSYAVTAQIPLPMMNAVGFALKTLFKSVLLFLVS